MLPLGADVVDAGQAVPVGTRQPSDPVHLRERGTPARQLRATVPFDDGGRVGERTDDPVVRRCVRRDRFADAVSSRPSRFRRLWPLDEHEDATASSLDRELSGSDLPPDRPFAPPQVDRRFRHTEL